MDKTDRALQMLAEDYFGDVQSVVKSLTRQIEEGELITVDAVYEKLHLECDAHPRVNQDHKAKVTLIVSDNYDAYECEIGEPTADLELRALAAFSADVKGDLNVGVCEDCTSLVTGYQALCYECVDRLRRKAFYDQKDESSFCDQN